MGGGVVERERQWKNNVYNIYVYTYTIYFCDLLSTLLQYIHVLRNGLLHYQKQNETYQNNIPSYIYEHISTQQKKR